MNQKETKEIIDRAIKEFRGFMPTLEAAIGALIVGQQIGWKPLFIIHEKRTIRKYEKILGISFRDVLEPEGPLAHKSVGYNAAKKLSNFWKAVKGETSIDKRQEIK